MAVLPVNDLYLVDHFFDLIQKIKNSQNDLDKFTFFGENLAKVASKNAKFAKVVLISAKGLLFYCDSRECARKRSRQFWRIIHE